MKRGLYVVVFWFCGISFYAQTPSWSVTAAEYQFSMTLTTFLTINGTTLSSAEDKVAAFIDGEVRGVGSVSYVESLQKYVAYLTVFANKNNETISFKVYDSANDVIVGIDRTIPFGIDTNLGTVFQSISLAAPKLSSQALLSSFDLKDVTEISNVIQNDTVQIMVPTTTALSELVANFTISTGANIFVDRKKQLPNVTKQNYLEPIVFEVLSEDEATLNSYVVNVQKQPFATTFEAILTSERAVYSNQNPLEVLLQVTKRVSAVYKSHFNTENAVIQSIEKQDDLTYKISLVAIEQGEYSITLPENTLQSLDNEPNPTATQLYLIFDTEQPYITSIERVSPLAELTNANQLEFTVTFSEAVDGFIPEVINPGVFNTIYIEPISNVSYKVLLSGTPSFTGRIFLEIQDLGMVMDYAGNILRTNTIISNND